MLRVLIAALFTLLFATGAQAATVGVPENVGPWGLSPTLPSGERGIFADLADAIAARTQIPIEIKFVPWGRMLEDVRSGDLDYAFGLVVPATSAAGAFTAIVGRVPMVAVARKGLALNSLADLHRFGEVGYMRGGSCGAAVDSDAAIHRVAQDGYVEAIRKLAAGHLDGWCSIEAGFAYTLGVMGMQDQMGQRLEYGDVKIGFQVTAKNAGSQQAQALSAVVDGLVKDGVAGRIFTHYLGAPYAP